MQVTLNVVTKSASLQICLWQYSQHDFMNLLHAHHIWFHEKTWALVLWQFIIRHYHHATNRMCPRLHPFRSAHGRYKAWILALLWRKISWKLQLSRWWLPPVNFNPKNRCCWIWILDRAKIWSASGAITPWWTPITYYAEMFTRCKSLTGL